MGTNLKSPKEVASEIMASWDQETRLSTVRMERDIAAALEEREQDRQQAYGERDALLAALTHFLPAHLSRHPVEDTEWDQEWTTIVCVHQEEAKRLRDTGLVEFVEHTSTWHIHDRELPLFAHLEMRDNDWDGSSTEAKYDRLRRLP